MKDKIDQIRTLLDELEAAEPAEDEAAFQENFSPFELPDIIKDISDFLQPLLTAYEAAFYWHLFRHSILENGSQYCRIGTRPLRDKVVRSNQTGGAVSLNQVSRVLNRLQEKGIIRAEGDANRHGTLYRVMIPEEIEECRELMEEGRSDDGKVTSSEEDADFYNVRENRLKVYERDKYKCQYCGKQLTRFTATLDHIIPVSEEGDNSYDNLATACLSCNSQKTNKPVGDFLAERNPTK